MRAKPNAAIGNWLRRARGKLGLSRKALALAAGISPGTLRNVEQSRHLLISRTAERLLQEIANRDAILAQTAPSALKKAAPPPDPESEPGAAFPSPLAHLRFLPVTPRRALLQVELDPHALRQLLRALGELLSRSQNEPNVDLSALHLVLLEKP